MCRKSVSVSKTFLICGGARENFRALRFCLSHYKNSAHCSCEKLRKSVFGSLKNMSFFNSHLSIEQLVNNADGGALETPEFAAHLAECEFCAANFLKFARAIDLMRRDDSQAAPAAAVEFAVNLFRANRFSAKQKNYFARRIAAILIADLSDAAPVFGERSAAANQERQMFFNAGERDVDLRVAKVVNGFALRGQVLGADASGCAILIETANQSFSAAIDDNGFFRVPHFSSIEDLRISLVFD